MLPVTVQFIVVVLAYALKHRMARRAEYVREENRVLEEALQTATGKRRLELSDEQRRGLATQGKALTPAEPEECCQIVRPSPIVARFRQPVARKYDSSQVRRRGRPRKANDIRELVLRIASENRNGTHLIHDRAPLYTEAWTKLLESEGVKSVRIAASSANGNPYAERFVGTARSECLDHFLRFGERHLRHLLGEFCVPCHGERFHQGLGGQLIRPPTLASNDHGTAGAIHFRSRLGGLLNHYHREPA